MRWTGRQTNRRTDIHYQNTTLCPDAGCYKELNALVNLFPIFRDSYLLKLGIQGLPVSDDDDGAGPPDPYKTRSDSGGDVTKSDNDNAQDDDTGNYSTGLTAEEELMKSMGLPTAFGGDLRIMDTDDEV